MANCDNLSELPVSRDEALSKAVEYCKGELVGHRLREFQTRFQESLRTDPKLFDAVKDIILRELKTLKHLVRILEILDLVIWFIGLKIDSIFEFWAHNIDSIRKLSLRFTESGSGSWLDSFLWNKQKTAVIEALAKKILTIEELLKHGKLLI